MKKLFCIMLIAFLIVSGNVVSAAPDLVTVADKQTGEAVTAAEFTQLLAALKSGTRAVKTQWHRYPSE
jgi:hypothetical protein